jgi:hypothetical protein
MPAAGALGALPLCGAMLSGDPEHAASTPIAAIPAIPKVNNLLETRFMITNLAIACEVQQRPWSDHLR